MLSQSKKDANSERFQNAEKAIRRYLAIHVQRIYKSWGMSDTQFDKYMGEYLHTTADGVRKFLRKRKSLHKDLMTYDSISDALEKIFTQYISDKHVDPTHRTQVQEIWALKCDEHMQELREAYEFLSVLKM